MDATEYRVQLDFFSGPLDLLLYLVRRNEVDVVDLPISRITSQFIEFLDVLEFIDLDMVGDFVVMASTLMEIKSRLVLPRPEEVEPEPAIEDDPRSELIQQLLEYKQFKEAAQALEEHASQWQERFPRLSDDRPTRGKDHSADRFREVELWDLVSALSRVVRQKVLHEQTKIQYDDTPIAVYVEKIAERVRREGVVAFTSLFDGIDDRHQIVGFFLGVLELLRHHGFRAEQPIEFGEIWISPPVNDSGPLPGQANPTSDRSEETASAGDLDADGDRAHGESLGDES